MFVTFYVRWNITLLLLVKLFFGLSHANRERFLVYVPSLGQTA